MKMKEICERTGLTERAVRLYCERGLLSPSTYTQNDREYLVFDDRDEKALRCIATLRAADFSLDEIRTMQNEPFLIEKTVREHTARLMRESAERLELCRRLQAIDPIKLRDIVDLADELNREEPHANVAPLKGPTFAEFCEQGGYCEDETLFYEEERLVRRGRIFTRCFIVWYVLQTMLSAARSGSFLGMLLTVGVNVLLIFCFAAGYSWARVILAIFQGIALFRNLYLLSVMDFIFDWILLCGLLLSILVLVIQAVCCYFLVFDKGLTAYQYEQRTDGDSFL